MCMAELGLALLLFCLDPAAVLVGYLGALLFAWFAVHHLVVRARSGPASCGCAGPSRPAVSRPGEAAGRSAAAALLAAVSLARTMSPPDAAASTRWLPWAGLVVPLVALALGQLRTPRPVELVKR